MFDDSDPPPYDDEDNQNLLNDDGTVNIPEDFDEKHCMSVDDVREMALRMFTASMVEIAGPARRGVTMASNGQRQRFLSREETLQIIRSHSNGENDKVIAVACRSIKEMRDKTQRIMYDLLDRILSNIFAEAAKHDLVDTSFDDTFSFRLNSNGLKFIETNLPKYFPSYRGKRQATSSL